MRIIRPIDIVSFLETSNDKVTANNTSTTETEWTAGTYNLGDRRYVDLTLYEVAASSTTDNPVTGAAADPKTWLIVGFINPYAMFDSRIARQTENSATVAVTIDPGEIVNGLALFNVSANTVNITMNDPTDGEVYNQDYIMQDNSAINNWYAYFFEPIIDKPDIAVLDLPNYLNATITVTADAGAGTAKIGELVLGRQQILGETVYGTGVGIKDYSIKDVDNFGNATITERAFSKRAEYDIKIETDKLSGINKILSDIRATPIVYVGDANRQDTIIYGYYRNYNTIYENPAISSINIEVEGLV